MLTQKQIQLKARAVAKDDPALDEGDSSEEEVIKISGSDASSEEDTATESKTVSFTKAYCSTNLIKQPAGKWSRPVTEALSSITSIFNPNAMKQ
jgi:hypothetical protein